MRHAGQTFAIPARSKSNAYQLSWPGDGLDPPLLRFEEQGQAARGPTGIRAPPLQAKVDTPVELKMWITDDAVHERSRSSSGASGRG